MSVDAVMRQLLDDFYAFDSGEERLTVEAEAQAFEQSPEALGLDATEWSAVIALGLRPFPFGAISTSKTGCQRSSGVPASDRRRLLNLLDERHARKDARRLVPAGIVCEEAQKLLPLSDHGSPVSCPYTAIESAKRAAWSPEAPSCLPRP